MAYLQLSSRRTRQPQSFVSLNPALPRPAFLFCPSVGLLDWTKTSRAGTKASGDSLRGTAHGVGYKVARAVSGGLSYGITQPLTADTWTIAALANPTSSDQQSTFYSQRNNASPFNQTSFGCNWDTTSALSAGRVGVYLQDTSLANNSVATTSTSLVDGRFHVFVATRSGTSTFPRIFVDGYNYAVSTNGSGTGTAYSSAQGTAVGNIGDYSAANTYCASCDVDLVVVWPYVLSDEQIRRLNPIDIWGAVFSPEARRLYFGAGGSIAYDLDAQPGGYTISGTAATLVRGYNLNAQPGTFTATGTAATLARGYVVDASPGSYALTGIAATLDKVTPGVYTLDAQPGAYSLTGVAATLTYTPLNAYTLDAQPGSYVITGIAATLTYAGASIWTDVGVSAATWSDVGTATSIWTDL